MPVIQTMTVEGNQINYVNQNAYASETYANIGSDNGLSPGRRQAII